MRKLYNSFLLIMEIFAIMKHVSEILIVVIISKPCFALVKITDRQSTREVHHGYPTILRSLNYWGSGEIVKTLFKQDWLGYF